MRSKKDKFHFVPCCVGVVHPVPFWCRRVYAQRQRQTRCTASLQATPPDDLVAHMRRCECDVMFRATVVQSKVYSRTATQIVEAYNIALLEGRACVSAPSLALQSTEVLFLIFEYLGVPLSCDCVGKGEAVLFCCHLFDVFFFNKDSPVVS